MKVFHLVKTTLGANWALLQIKELITIGCEVHVFLPDKLNKFDDYESAGAVVHILNTDVAGRGLMDLLRALWSFRKLVEGLKPDIIHSHFVGTTLFMRCAMLWDSTPRIFQVPGPLHLESFFTRKLELILSGQADRWIATCRKTESIYLESGIEASRLGMCFYGTDVASYIIRPRLGLRERLRLADDSLIVGMVAYAYAPKLWLGRKIGIKGHEDLINAMALVVNKNPRAVCVFVGGPWKGASNYFRKIVELSKSKLGEKGIFLGSRNDVADIYSEFDIVVHPSHSENLGGAAESLLIGVPTLTTSVGGFPDIVHDGVTGWLVPPKSPTVMAEKIVEMLANPEEASRRAKAGKELVIVQLDVRNTSACVFNFYKQILKVDNV